MSRSTNTTITAFEELILQDIGQVTLGNLGALIALTIFYGIFIIMFSISMHMTIHQGLPNHAAWAMLIGTSINFAIQTVQWIMMSTWLIFLLQIFLEHNGNLSLSARTALEGKAQNHILYTMDDFRGVTLIISDAFVIWRSSILFTSKSVMLIPLTCLFGTIGTYIAAMVIPMDNIIASTTVNWALLAFSIATNLVSTGMIAWCLWIYRKHTLPNMGGNKSPVYPVIVALVESGAVFCFIQIVFLVIQVEVGLISKTPSSASISDAITQEVLFCLAAIYPTAIFLLCHKQGSCIDYAASVSMNIGNTSQLLFASVEVSQHQSIAVPAINSCEAKSSTDLETRGL